MKVGSVFTGFGGLDLGLQRAGLTIDWQIENNVYARRVLEKHWPGIRRPDDVRTFQPVPRKDWAVDLICGGDPCQENSQARGSQLVNGTSPAIHFLRIVDELRPRLVLRENPWPSRRDAPWTWYRFRAGLESLGYAVLPFRLRACCLGADHRRDRVFLLAELADALRPGLEGQDSGVFVHDHATRRARRRPAPRICRRADGVPHRMERIKGLGNAADVEVGEWIGRRLMEGDEAKL